MALTDAQIAVLAADIAANPADFAAIPHSPDGAFTIAGMYAQTAVPDYWVWRTFVTKAEFVQTTSVDGTVFNWTGNGFITRTAGEQTAWHEIFNGTDACNPSLINVRQAFADILSGTGVAAANRTHLLAVARRKANRLEKLFAVGSGTTASPSTMGYEGTIGYDDVLKARP